MKRRYFRPAFVGEKKVNAVDVLIIFWIASLIYAGIRLSGNTPPIISGPSISLSPRALPWYTLFSMTRMCIAFALTLCFSLSYGYIAARSLQARKILLPLLDVLQSIPILSFLPVVLLSMSAVLPKSFAAELASVVLIFTSQAWNLTFSFYQSMTTIPQELREASAVFRLNRWLRFRTLELPFSAIGLIWNSMMSWSGGWFFLMASETFVVGNRDFRLPGLGSYLQTAANQGNVHAVILGLATLILLVTCLDQFIWQPVLAWANKFRLEMVEGEDPPRSWFYEKLLQSSLLKYLRKRVTRPVFDWLDVKIQKRSSGDVKSLEGRVEESQYPAWYVALMGVLVIGAIFGAYQASMLMSSLDIDTWIRLVQGLLATLLRVAVSLVIALLWTVPVGIAIGSSRRVASICQPIVQVISAVPATALFPVLLLLLLRFPGGLNVAAVVLMLMGTQWYLLFNVIAGAASIPNELRQTTRLLQLPRADQWRVLFLPAVFPYIITGAITASGGAWNASIVAEQVNFGGEVHVTTGIGALIAEATEAANYPLLFVATLMLIITVVAINRLFWAPLYRIAERRYRMD